MKATSEVSTVRNVVWQKRDSGIAAALRHSAFDAVEAEFSIAIARNACLQNAVTGYPFYRQPNSVPHGSTAQPYIRLGQAT